MQMPFAQRNEMMMDITGGVGADVVFGCVGNTKAFRDGVNMMKRVGTYVEVGNIGENKTVEFDLATDLCFKHATYRGMMINSPSAFNKAFGLLQRHEKLELAKIFTHRCDLNGLNETLSKGRDTGLCQGAWWNLKNKLYRR